MLEYTQFLIFELGYKCNFSKIHPKCPILQKPIGDRVMPNEKIVEVAAQAYNELGFTGLIGWHFYNEPMLQWKRMLPIMEAIREKVPQSRFILWSNGSILIEDERFKMFEKVVITNYNLTPEHVYKKFYPNAELTIGYENFDDRLIYDGQIDYTPCLRPFVEFIIADSGDIHLCCQDWERRISIGNVLDTDLAELVERKKKISLSICHSMDDSSPEVCLKCNGRIGLPSFDSNIANKTFIYLQEIRNK